VYEFGPMDVRESALNKEYRKNVSLISLKKATRVCGHSEEQKQFVDLDRSLLYSICVRQLTAHRVNSITWVLCSGKSTFGGPEARAGRSNA